MTQAVRYSSFYSGRAPAPSTVDRRAPHRVANALIAGLVTLGIVSLAYAAFGANGPTAAFHGARPHSSVATTSTAESTAPVPVNSPASASGKTDNKTSSAFLPASLPVSITIPAISVRSPLIQTGLNKDGTPAVPAGSDIDKASWLTTSPTPGEIGPSVILGHVDTIHSGPSVFYNLHKLQPGQPIMVARQDGTTATFSVKSVEVFDKDNFPNQRVYGRTNDAELHLITCGGDWDRSRHDYTQNVVVFAELKTTD